LDLRLDGDARAAAAGVGGGKPGGLARIEDRDRREPLVADARSAEIGQGDPYASAGGVEDRETRKAGKAARHRGAVLEVECDDARVDGAVAAGP
jgi:hypothetical protein